MTAKHKMTIRISRKLHEEIKLQAVAEEMGMSEYVVDVLKDNQTEVCRLHDMVRDYKNMAEKQKDRRIAWRGLAIAFLIGLVVQFLLLNKLNKDYVKLYNEGVPQTEDARIVGYYKSIIANKCKIEAR